MAGPPYSSVDTKEFFGDTDFRRKMRGSESSDDYSINNKIDKGRRVLGGYQFQPARLDQYRAATGEDFTDDEFLRNSDLQDRVMDWHEQDLLDFVMKDGLDAYIGQTIAGAEVTPSGLVAGGHLGGRTGLKQFLLSGGEYNPPDKYGTRISDYVSKFADQNLFGFTPQRPQARPFTLATPDARQSYELRNVRPKMRPKGLLDQ